MNRQSYAYAVCLVALVAGLYALPKTVDAILSYRNPLSVVQPVSDLDVSTFEKFRFDLETKLQHEAFLQIEYDHLDKDGGWNLYLAARDARIQQVRDRSRTTAFAYGILVSIAAVLFLTHLKMARRSKTATP